MAQVECLESLTEAILLLSEKLDTELVASSHHERASTHLLFWDKDKGRNRTAEELIELADMWGDRHVFLFSLFVEANLYREYKLSNTVFCARLLQVLRPQLEALKSGSFIVFFLLARSTLEQIALHNWFVKKTRTALANRADSTPLDIHDRLSELSSKSYSGTRMDLKRMLAEKFDMEKLAKQKTSYAQEENAANIAAEQILNCIDLFGKRLKGTRKLYDYMCEMAHPNIGQAWSVYSQAAVRENKYGIPMIERVVDSKLPMETGLSRPGVAEAISHYSQALSLAPKILLESEQMLPDVLDVTQALLRTRTAIKRVGIGRNETCICGSGKKFKKCCGA
jgi:hypothetical protein